MQLQDFYILDRNNMLINNDIFKLMSILSVSFLFGNPLINILLAHDINMRLSVY